MKKELSKLEFDCESIRNNIKECGKLYILVAYKVYEIYYYETYKEKYKNIVECCENEFGFKKSTTYNLLNIVKKFGTVENGMITYNSVCKYTDYSYKQLVCMLGLSAEQLEKITPDTTIAEIHKEKKVQPVGKIKNSVIAETPKIIEKTSEPQNNVIEVSPEQLQLVGTETISENVNNDLVPVRIKNELVKQQLELYENDVEKTISALIDDVKRYKFGGTHFQNLYEAFKLKSDNLLKENKELHSESESKLRAMLEQRDSFREQVLKSKETIEEQSEIIADYKKNNKKLIERNSILETDNKTLKIRVQQLEDELKKIKEGVET